MDDEEKTKRQQTYVQLAALREKNLQFFKKEYPSIYHMMAEQQLSTLRLNVLPNSNEMDLYEDGKSLYNGEAKKVAEREVDEFCRFYSEGVRVNSVPSYDKTTFDIDRYFFNKARNVVNNDVFTMVSRMRGYRLGNFYPLVVFVGIGLGYQIVELLKRSTVNHIIVAENNLEKFAASLFCVDWQELSEGFCASEGKSFNFVFSIGKGAVFYGVIWNKLLELVPVFPALTIFFNHLGDEENRKIIDQINGDIVQVPTSWGNHDDEINQMNNALHNIYDGARSLPLFKEPIKGNIVVVGAGPSLNESVEGLRKIRQHVTVISCGTALRVLYTHGIKPDIHLEIESDYVTERVIRYIGDPEWVRSIKHIALLQVTPFVYRLFDDKRFFLKYPSTCGFLINAISPFSEYATPTVVNGACAIAAYYQPKAIFLFGVDFGFRDTESHHADGTMFDLDEIEDELKDLVNWDKKGFWYTRGVDGSPIRTEPIMFGAKRRLEALTKSPSYKDIPFYNCSNGAVIENVTWLDKPEKYIDLIVNDAEASAVRLDHVLFAENDSTVNYETEVKIALNVCRDGLKQLTARLLKEVSLQVNTLQEVNLLCSRIIHAINYAQHILPESSKLLIEGSVKHFLYALYGFCHLSEPDTVLNEYYQLWKENFTAFLEGVVEHFESVVFKEFNVNTDLWLVKSLFDSEYDDTQYYSRDGFDEIK